MNKKIAFFLFCCTAGVPSIVLKAEQCSAIVMQGREVNEVQQVDFEDFFNADGQEPRAVTRIKKKPLTKAQLVLMQVGISVAMGIETAYKCCKSLWLWVLACFYSASEENNSHEA